MPAVYVLETQMPQDMIDDVNDYMDEYRESKNKESLAKTLVGQIHSGEQLLLDHTDKRLIAYNDFVCGLGAEYIRNFANMGNKLKNAKRVEVDETWSVHSYDGDYNPIHDHGTKTLMGISCTCWTKVPQQILDQPTSGTSEYSLYNASGDSDGCISFQYGQGSLMDTERLKPPQSCILKPQVGKFYMFPSWLQHMVYPFEGPGERRTVAANLNVWRGSDDGTKH